jgi:hypothetical protein
MIKVRIKKVPKARTGYQVQGALVNDVPAMGGMDYNAYIGKEKLKESKYITAVPREEANLEAEGGETVYGDINGDGMPEHKIIKGPRHAQGGVPLSLPEDTFIFSDTRAMRIKDPEILTMFGKGGANKSFTPAELAKQYDVQKYRKLLEDPDTDAIERKTAELMIKKYVIKLGCLALTQESMKGFPQGIPAVAKPCMEAKGLTEQDILPSKEIQGLNEQLKQQMQQQEGGDENQVQEAVDMNEGNPVAEPTQQEPQGEMPPSPEEMMMYGGHRRLRRGQMGMEQVPQEMMEPQQEQGGGDEMMEIVQEVQSALERGADPSEVVMNLLENNVPPQAIVEIFAQLGADPQQAAGLVEQVISQAQGGGQEQMMQEQPMSEEEAMMMQQQQMQQQAPPMAMYGMTMGGYDMPFFDIPQAEYGMSMGSGMSQNYQGRPKRIPGSGPMFPLTRADNGIVVDGSNMTEEQLQRAIWNEQQKALKDWKDKNPGKDPKTSGYKEPQINVKRKDASGKVITSKLKSSGFIIPEGKDISDLKGFPDTPRGRTVAAQYMLIEDNLKNPIVQAEIIKNTKEAIENPDAWTGKGGKRNANNTWSKKYGSLPDDEEIIKQALNHQKRNLMFEANEVDPQLFTDVGDALDKASTVVSEKYINPKTGKPYTLKEAQSELKRLTDKGYTSIAKMSEKLKVPLDPLGKDRVLQQATMHSYAKSYQNFQKGDYDSNPDAKYAMDNFLGNVSLVHAGANDETSMGALYGTIGNKISPLDDKYNYANNNWYDFANSSKGDSRFTTYGDTSAGHRYMVGKRNYEFEDLPPEVDPNCQCADPNKPNYGQYKDANGNCSCTPPDVPKDKPKNCPCRKSDGTEINMTPDKDGNCPPCTEEQTIETPAPPAEWWLQDTIKTTGAFGDLMGIKKYMPWAPGVELGTPRPTFMDPTRELAANAEQANIQTQGMAQFAGPQALSARSSGIQGQAAKNAADVLAKYNNANVNVANQFEMKANDIRNQESMLKQATAQRVYDQNTVANQQFDNAKLAMRNQLRNYYTNAITNRWKTDALNQMFPNYAVSAGVGGRMDYRPSERTPNPTQTTGKTREEWFMWCKNNGDPNPSACAQRMMDNKGSSSSSSDGADANMIKTMYGQYGGAMYPDDDFYEDGGYVHVNSWLPFIM